MSFGAQLGLQAAGQVFGAGMGMMMGKWNDERQEEQQRRLQAMQIQGQKEMMDYGYGKQLQMWKDTSYGPQMELMRKAGVNPALIYGMSGGGGQTTGNASGSVSGATAQQNPGEVQAMTAMGLQMGQMAAQTELLKAQAEKTKTETENIGEGGANRENTILDNIIKKYTGMEAKDMYERVNAPNRAVQMETVLKEMEARQGIAGTIYEMWLEGKLHEKSTAEIENLLLGNEKTKANTRAIIKSMDLLEENIKGAKLDNIIKELETKLQTETGIDKNSPTWLKIMGRLFVQLFNK